MFNGETTDESAYPTLALVHAICAVAYLADPSTSDAAPAEAQKAQMANDHLFETGRSRLGTYFILSELEGIRGAHCALHLAAPTCEGCCRCREKRASKQLEFRLARCTPAIGRARAEAS